MDQGIFVHYDYDQHYSDWLQRERKFFQTVRP